MTPDETVQLLSLLDDVESQMTKAIEWMSKEEDELLESLNENSVWLESWRDDIRSALRLVTTRML